PLVRITEPFDHPDWLFEIKHDGFRALAIIDGHTCRFVSRRGHEFSKFHLLSEEIAHSVKAMGAILDGEIVCLGPDGRCRFYDLLFRRDWPHSMPSTCWSSRVRTSASDRSSLVNGAS